MIDWHDVSHIDRQLKWDRSWLNKAMEFAKDSKDPSTKVGAVIINELNQIVASGYNGFSRGVVDSEERLFNRDLKYKLMCHAEQNAIWVAGEKARGSTIYIWPTLAPQLTCNECAKAIIQIGIKRIVGFTVDPEQRERAERWQESYDIAEMMLKEAGVRISEVTQ